MNSDEALLNQRRQRLGHEELTLNFDALELHRLLPWDPLILVKGDETTAKWLCFPPESICEEE